MNLLIELFFISDGTAITAEVLGHAVLSQFPLKMKSYTLPFVSSVERAEEIKIRLMKFIKKWRQASGFLLYY